MMNEVYNDRILGQLGVYCVIATHVAIVIIFICRLIFIKMILVLNLMQFHTVWALIKHKSVLGIIISQYIHIHDYLLVKCSIAVPFS